MAKKFICWSVKQTGCPYGSLLDSTFYTPEEALAWVRAYSKLHTFRIYRVISRYSPKGKLLSRIEEQVTEDNLNPPIPAKKPVDWVVPQYHTRLYINGTFIMELPEHLRMFRKSGANRAILSNPFIRKPVVISNRIY